MALWSAFCGPTYQALSPSIAADQAINIYVETRQIPGSAKEVTFYGTPGLRLKMTIPQVSCRGQFNLDGRTWAVYANGLYELDLTANTATLIGAVEDDGGPVSFASNGQAGSQLGIVSGGSAGAGGLYVLDLVTGSFTTVTLPFTGPVMITFLDGYGIINQHETPTCWFSNLEDLTVWDALDFFTRANTPDNVKAIAVTRDRLWLLGSQTSTLYYDSGDADTPFLPYPGTTFQTGIVTHWAFSVFNDVLYWIAQNSTGVASVVRAVDPSVQTISTPPIARFLENATTLDTAEMLVYGQHEHIFAVITVPGSPDDVQTYAYDEREQLWHARAGRDAVTGRYTRWRARGVTEANGEILVGDYATGELYALDLDVYTDNNRVIRRERTTPYAGAENQWIFLDQFELGMQAGVGLSSGQGSAPTVELQLSRDSAQTWVSAGFASLGAVGNYTARAIWRKLGRFRSDRMVLRVIQTDPVKCVWGPGAWLKITPGTGAL